MRGIRWPGGFRANIKTLRKVRSLFGNSVLGGIIIGGALAGATVNAGDDFIHPQKMKWHNDFIFGAQDHASLRRGYEVYRQVCSTCHSLDIIHFRELVGVTHTKDQAKALAHSMIIEDGPNAEGEMYERPAKLTDLIPKPYANPQFAMFINGGAEPPDLSLMVKARDAHEDYIFTLLTGYRDEPSGVTVRKGNYYNPYFEGGNGIIAMAPPLSDGAVEYEPDWPHGDPGLGQTAKDIVCFLSWTAEPEKDKRKKLGMQCCFLWVALVGMCGYSKRFRWAPIKNRRISWVD